MNKLLKILLTLVLLYFLYKEFIEKKPTKENMINLTSEKNQMITFIDNDKNKVNRYTLITFKDMVMDDNKYALNLYTLINKMRSDYYYLYPTDINDTRLTEEQMIDEIKYAMKQNDINTYDEFTSEPLFVINTKDTKLTNNIIITGQFTEIKNRDPQIKPTYTINPYKTNMNNVKDGVLKGELIDDNNMNYGISFRQLNTTNSYLSISNKTPNNPPAYLPELRQVYLNKITTLGNYDVYFITSKQLDKKSELISLELSDQ
jgi:hypothetical protein